MSQEVIRPKAKYYSVIGGSFRTQVPQDHPEAVMRQWEATDGKTGTKYERIVDGLSGFIEKIEFHDGEYGLNINITLDKGEDGLAPIISLSASSREGEDFLKKVPNVDLSREVFLRPFSFNGDEQREVRGLEVVQKDDAGKFTKKVKNHFWDEATKQPINGYPAVDDASSFDKEDWKVFFITARKHMVRYAQENVCPKLSDASRRAMAHDRALDEVFEEGSGRAKQAEDAVDVPTHDPALDEGAGVEPKRDNINPDDIPF